MYPRSEKRFVGVDVSDSGDDVLIQQCWLNGPVCTEQLFLEHRGLDGDCFGSERRPSVRFKVGQRSKCGNPPKSSRITENESAAISRARELPDAVDVIVSLELLSMAQISQLTRHTQLDAERRTVVSDNGELFAASCETGDSSATKELFADRYARGVAVVKLDNIRAVKADGLDLSADNQRFEGLFEVFNLR